MLEQQSFLGSSITNWSCSLGWNETSSQLSVLLVDDPLRNEAFTPYTEHSPDIGEPVFFQYGDFEFGGLLQNWERTRGPDGNPVYSVSIIDPRELLAGTQLILSNYAAGVSAVPNIINPYGYWESEGFGMSEVNQAGMPWYKILTTISVLTTPYSPVNIFGGPIRFKGHDYFVDLSNLPAVPNYYRMGGLSISLLDAINTITSDFGADYFVSLLKDPNGMNVIKVYVTYRTQPPNLTAIQEFIDENHQVVRSSQGRELRNENTSSFLVGGYKADLTQISYSGTDDPLSHTIWPFWGFDGNGNAVIGEGFNDEHRFTVDSRGVWASGLGATYDCSVGELRSAMGGQDVWESFITINKPQFAYDMGIEGSYLIPTGIIAKIMQAGIGSPLDFSNTSKRRQQIAAEKFEEQKVEIINNIYNFVKTIADDMYGKRFLVKAPHPVVPKREPETNNLLLSIEPCDGGWLPEGSSPLGISVYNEDIFRSQDGKFEAFVRFDNANEIDLSKIDTSSYVVEDSGLYLKCSVDSRPVFTDWQTASDPRVVITLPDGVQKRTRDEEGNKYAGFLVKMASGLLRSDLSKAEIRRLYDSISGPAGLGAFAYYGPEMQMPTAAAIPMQSNIETYGPWTAVGAAGKTYFEQDTSLVPWNFGGFEAMNLAAQSKVANSLTMMIVGETGYIEVPGVPTIGLGDILRIGGPTVTGIDVAMGPQGFTTTYKMRTYTPRFGVLSKNSAERWQRLGQTAQQQRRAMRDSLKQLPPPESSIYKAREDSVINSRKDMISRSPHEMLSAHVIDDVMTGSGLKRTIVTTSTITEANSFILRNREGEDSVAAVGWNSLLRPVGVKYEGQSYAGPNLSKLGDYKSPSGTNIDYRWLPPMIDTSGGRYFTHYATGIPAIDIGMNPAIGRHDVEYMYASGLEDMSLLKAGVLDNWDNIEMARRHRMMAHKVPMILTGYGYDLTGRPVPRDDENTYSFTEDFKMKPHLWKTGPLNVRWNELTGTWDCISPTFPSVYVGTLIPDEQYILGGYGHGYKARLDQIITYQSGNDIRYPLVGFDNPLEFPLNSGSKCLLTYTGSNANINSGVFVVTNVQPTRLRVPCDVACYQGYLGVAFREIIGWVDNNHGTSKCSNPSSGITVNQIYQYR